VRHILIILSIFLFSFIYISCSKSSDDGSKSTDNTTTSHWTKQLGTTSSDYGYSVTTDSSGNIYVTGYTYGDLDGNTSSGGQDIFLVQNNGLNNLGLLVGIGEMVLQQILQVISM